MSCMFLPGGDAGSPEIRPLPFRALADLQAEGLRTLNGAFPQLAQAKPRPAAKPSPAAKKVAGRRKAG